MKSLSYLMFSVFLAYTVVITLAYVSQKRETLQQTSMAALGYKHFLIQVKEKNVLKDKLNACLLKSR